MGAAPPAAWGGGCYLSTPSSKLTCRHSLRRREVKVGNMQRSPEGAAAVYLCGARAGWGPLGSRRAPGNVQPHLVIRGEGVPRGGPPRGPPVNHGLAPRGPAPTAQQVTSATVGSEAVE